VRALRATRHVSCVDGALASSANWRSDDCGRVQSCVWPVGAAIATTAGPDVIREMGPDHEFGLEALDTRRFSHLDERPIDIMPSAPPQP
jgi:hypothetical protein